MKYLQFSQIPLKNSEAFFHSTPFNMILSCILGIGKTSHRGRSTLGKKGF
jgi:hypothetical protein